MAKGKFAQKLLNELFPDKAAIDKAANAGYDVDRVWYHGGAKEIEEINPEKFGSVTQTPAAKEAFFLTDTVNSARGFANNSGGNNVQTFVYRPEKTATINWSEAGSGLSLRSEGGQRLLAAYLKEAKDEGLNGLLIKNSDDTATAGEKAGDVLAVLNPTSLRSPGAKFENNSSRNVMAGIGSAAIGLNAYESDASEFVEPKSKFGKLLLADYVNKNPENLLTYDHQKTGPVLRGPVNAWAAKAAEWALKYNQERKKRIHPLLDLLIPAGEMPYEYLNKKAYGDEITIKDRANAILGLM